MNSNQTATRPWTRCTLGLASLLLASALATPVQAQQQQQYLPWKQVPGAARDIGIGPQPRGDIWVIGTIATVGGDYAIYRWNRKANNWDQMPGGGVRIDVGPGGPMVVNSAGGLYVWNGAGWDDRGKNRIRDVGVGGDGSTWYLGGDEHPGGFEIFKYGGPKVAGSGVRIDVDNKGNPWIVNKANDVYRFNGSAFVHVPGVKAIDIGIDAESGTVYAVGVDGWPYKWTGSTWLLSASGVTHALNHISVDPAGMPWGVAGNGVIFSSRDQAEYVRMGSLITPPPRKGLTVINDSDDYSWVTIEQFLNIVPSSKATACMAPGQESSWNYPVMGGNEMNYKVRVERTKTENCKSLPGNAHVTCDTHANWKVDSHTKVHGVLVQTGKAKEYMLFKFNDSCRVDVSSPN